MMKRRYLITILLLFFLSFAYTLKVEAETDNRTIYTGKQEINGYEYYFDENGVMQKGFVTVEGKLYLYGRQSGKMQFGWHEVDGYMYYFNLSTGIMVTGNQTIDGHQYYFYSIGRMKENFVEIDGKVCYSFENGTKAVGWNKIAGER